MLCTGIFHMEHIKCADAVMVIDVDPISKGHEKAKTRRFEGRSTWYVMNEEEVKTPAIRWGRSLHEHTVT